VAHTHKTAPELTVQIMVHAILEAPQKNKFKMRSEKLRPTVLW
jgi:hypothetical protein